MAPPRGAGVSRSTSVLLDGCSPGRPVRWVPRIPTAVFMGAGVIRELGYFNPPGCTHLFLDNAWRHYGEALGTLRYLPDVIIEHLHFLAGKAAKDALYGLRKGPQAKAEADRIQQLHGSRKSGLPQTGLGRRGAPPADARAMPRRRGDVRQGQQAPQAQLDLFAMENLSASGDDPT